MDTDNVSKESDNKIKRILIFSLTYFPKFVGGDGVAIQEITNRISDEDMIFDLITARFDSNLPKYEKIGNVNVYRIGFTKKDIKPEEMVRFPMYLVKILFPILAFIKAVKLHSKYKYNLIWCMMTYMGFPAVFFNFIFPKVPVLLTLQDGDPIEYIVERKRIRMVFPIFKKIFKIPEHVQSISNYLAEFAKDMGYKGDISVIPNAVNFDFFSTRDEDKIKKIKKDLNKKDGEVWLFTSSRLVTKNAVDDVVRAIPLLPNNIKFLVAGIGPDKEKLDFLIDELEIADRVIFLGHITHDLLPSYLHASDIFVRPSRSEGFGNSFVEAMAARTPIIATDVGGIADFLFHKETGLVCGVNDSDDIAHKVFMYMQDVELRKEIIDNAEKLAKEKYDWNLISKDMQDVINRVAD